MVHGWVAFVQAVSRRRTLSALCLAALSAPTGLRALPAGFVKTPLATGLDACFIAAAPDGRVFFTEKIGKIRVIKNDQLLPTPFVDISGKTNNANERGLIGLAFDPDFTRNGYVYAYYCDRDTHGYLMRWTAAGDVAAAGSETRLFDLGAHSGPFHHGGDVNFGPDGKLYMTLGNGAGALGNPQKISQDPTDLFGSILRINSDGTIPADNPFYATNTGNNRAVWTYGNRNVFCPRINPVNNRCLFDDVMDGNKDDELDECKAGGNYGYGGGTNTIAPLLTYGGGGAAQIGGLWYDGPSANQFPAAYRGKFFYGNSGGGDMRMYDYDAKKMTVFDNFGGDCPISFAMNPRGAVYLTTRCGSGAQSSVGYGKVWKLSYPAGAATVPPVLPGLQPEQVMRWSARPGMITVTLLKGGPQSVELTDLGGKRLAGAQASGPGELRLGAADARGVHLLVWHDGLVNGSRTVAKVIFQ